MGLGTNIFYIAIIYRMQQTKKAENDRLYENMVFTNVLLKKDANVTVKLNYLLEL